MSENSVAAVMPATAGIVRQYYELTKPGISQMVALSALAGYYLAIPTALSTAVASASTWMHFGATMLGTVAVSSGSCVMNHVIERDHDAKMKRTASRPIPAGIISVRSATTFSIILTVLGLGLLATVNTLTLALAVITWLSYVVVYTPMKRRSSLAVIVGGIPGALPFAGGWTAVRGSFDVEAMVLFAILFFWQLPHFYALSWMYRADYRSGGFVLRSIEDDSGRALGMQMLITSALTWAAALMPTFLHMTGWMYGVGAMALSVWLTVECLLFFKDHDAKAARRVLLTSYAFLMGIIVLMFLDKQ